MRVLTYDVVDDYDTLFAPGVFRESLEARMPRIVWGHDWREPLGRYIEYDDQPGWLDLVGEFDDFDAVPRARQAYAQLLSGTIDQASVGFVPIDSDRVDGRTRFTKGRLDEVSLVIAGAVPGTQLLAVRARPIVVRDPEPMIPLAKGTDLLLDLYQGRIDLADALAQVKAMAQTPDDEPDPESDPETEPESDPEVAGDEPDPEPDPEPEQVDEAEQPEPEPEPEPEQVTDDDIDTMIDSALALLDGRSAR